MKIKLTALAITALVAAAFATVQPASAQNNARFKFAPNIYRHEEVRSPKASGPVHSVKNGSVPTGTSFLGLDPNMLKPAPKPVAPQPQPQMQVAATPSFSQVTPQIAVPRASFNSNFGRPAGQLAPPQVPLVASAPMAQPPLPQVATAKSLQLPKPAPKAAVKRPAMQASRSVSGKLRKPAAQHAPARTVATAGKGIDSYGKNFGYVPGAYLPAVGMTAQADVYGQLVKQHR